MSIFSRHYNYPYIPDLPGIKEFEGTILHSHDYRVPEQFTKQTVLVIGGGPSGCDIVLDMAEFTNKVTKLFSFNPLLVYLHVCKTVWGDLSKLWLSITKNHLITPNRLVH